MGMIERRFVPMLKERDIPYSIDIFHTETDPKHIAEKICAEAEKLHVKAVVISHHQRSKLAQFFSVRWRAFVTPPLYLSVRLRALCPSTFKSTRTNP